MNRKKFIAALLPLATTATVMAMAKQDIFEEINLKNIPPYLKKGDQIGICSPAGFITLEDIQPAIVKIKEWGFEIKIGNSIGKRDFTLGGTDEERKNDFQQMLDDKNIKAILCARGGYGIIRIIDQLNFTQFIKTPKWIIGFSDVTFLHNHINRNFGIASIHSKMCNSFPVDWNAAEPAHQSSIDSIRKCLTGEKIKYDFQWNSNNKAGSCTGQLVGGNLKTIETLAGTKSDLITKNKILFVEDAGEYMYSIDRMFWNLKRTGKLAELKGLIIGGFKNKKDDAGEEFGKTLETIVLEKVKEYQYPVCFDFPVGHQKNNVALKCGITHYLKITEASCTLKEQ